MQQSSIRQHSPHPPSESARPIDQQADAALRNTADAVWAGMRRDRRALRVLLRDLGDFPELLDRIWAEVRNSVYDEFARWLTEQAELGRIRVADPAATAAVLLASLTYYPILETLIGHRPDDVEADRFVDAGVAHAVATLTAA